MEEQRNIERYLDGEMNAAERKALEKRLAEDDSFSEALGLEKAARASIRAAGRADLQAKMDDWEEEWQGSRQNKGKLRPRWLRWGSIAAAILVLAVAAWWVTTKDVSPSPGLYANYFTPYDPPATLRGTGSSSTWEKAITAYAEKKYELAATTFSDVRPDEIPDYLSSFYAAVSLLASDPPKPSKALRLLDQVLQQDSDYKMPARWYRALALIYLDRFQEAQAELQFIKELGDYRRTEIQDLLDQLGQ